MHAVPSRSIDIVNRLLEVPGIDVNARDFRGQTALMIAHELRLPDIEERLLNVPAIMDNYGSFSDEEER